MSTNPASSLPKSTSSVLAAPAPAAEEDHASTLPYKNQCSALGVKANTRLLRNEATLRDADRLDFTMNYIGGAGLQCITDALAENTRLESLNLSGNGLTNESVVFFCRAVVKHPSLAVLDFSNNPISLPAGLAIVELLHKNTKIADVKLFGTLIDDALQQKIRRCLNLNKTAVAQQLAKSTAAATHAASGGRGSFAPAETPYQKVVREHQEKKAKRKSAAAAAAAATDSASTSATGAATAKDASLAADAPSGTSADPLTEYVATHLSSKHLAAIPRGEGGWAVVNIFVSTTPLDFSSELDAIRDALIPRLNEAFAEQRINFQLLAMYNDVPPLSKEKAKTSPPRVGIVPDHQRPIASAAFFVGLLGEKIGVMEFVPNSAASERRDRQGRDADGAGRLPRPVQMVEFELASDRPRIALTRQRPLSMRTVPEALISTLSDDPHLSMPDPTTHSVKVAVAEAQGVPHNMSSFDYDVYVRTWQRRSAWVRSVMAELPPCAVANDYPAVFASVDKLGQTRMANLNPLIDTLFTKLTAMTHGMFPTVAKPRPSPSFRQSILDTVMTRATKALVGKKNISGKMDLYVVTPPTRNITVVTTSPGNGGSSVMASFLQRSLKKTGYLVAHHFARDVLVSGAEPSDYRSLFLSLIAQLSVDKTVPSHIATEVDLVKIKDHFVQALLCASGDAGEQRTVLVAVDGLDDMDPPVLPCEALRLSDTGADAWVPPMTSVTIQKPLQPAPPSGPRNAAGGPAGGRGQPAPPAESPVAIAATQAKLGFDGFDWIPVCLAKNVRMVLSAQRGSKAHLSLEQRGHDSCDTMSLGDIGDSDVEAILLAQCAAFNVSPPLSDEEINAIRSKADARNPRYLRYVLERLRQRNDAPQYTTRQTFIAQLPETVGGMGEWIIQGIEKDFGAALTKAVLSLLLCSRWGLREFELSELLVKQAYMASNDAQQAVELKPMSLHHEAFQKLLRALRPAVSDNTELLLSNQPTCGTNGLHQLVAIQCREFAKVARQYVGAIVSDAATEVPNRFLDGTPIDVALKHSHQQLAYHYRRHLSQPYSPICATAVREFPYHCVAGHLWNLLETEVVSLAFLSQVYLQELGYCALREFIRAFNRLDEMVRTPGMATMVPAGVEGIKLKLREYIYFMRDHNVNLVQFPQLVRQIAVTCPADSHLHIDAREHFKQFEHEPHFELVNKLKARLHRDVVNCVQFAPTGLRFASCSDDRTLKICNLYAEPLLHVNQSISKVTQLRYSNTSRYIAAACEDRSVMVIDASNANVISKLIGHTATIRSVALSSRGRFVASGSDDRTLRLWESESGRLLVTVPHAGFSHHTSSSSAVSLVLPHPYDEDTFYAMCDKRVIGWKVKDSAWDACVETAMIIGHNSLSLATFHLAGDGNFVYTCAKDVPPPSNAPLAFRTEDHIKLHSLKTGRCLATLSMGIAANVAAAGPVYTALSPDERVLVSAIRDGTMHLHHVDPMTLSPDAEHPAVITPSRKFVAFQELSTPSVTAMCFSHDSTLIAAIGNSRQVKVWYTMSPAQHPVETQDHVDAEAQRAESVTLPKHQSKRPASEAMAEFLMDQPAVTVDWSPNPAEEGGEMVVGDCMGRVHCLRLRR